MNLTINGVKYRFSGSFTVLSLLKYLGFNTTNSLETEKYLRLAINHAIDRKKRVVYITKRWKIISLLIKTLPERIIRLFF